MKMTHFLLRCRLCVSEKQVKKSYKNLKRIYLLNEWHESKSTDAPSLLDRIKKGL